MAGRALLTVGHTSEKAGTCRVIELAPNKEIKWREYDICLWFAKKVPSYLKELNVEPQLLYDKPINEKVALINADRSFSLCIEFHTWLGGKGIRVLYGKGNERAKSYAEIIAKHLHATVLADSDIQRVHKGVIVYWKSIFLREVKNGVPLIIELGCMDNDEDLANITSKNWQEEMAKTLATAIKEITQ